MTTKKTSKKTGTDIRSFIIFLLVCGLVVLVATYPWVLAIAAGLAIFLYFKNEKVKIWINNKLKKKEKKS